mmetsp:Transcript_17867/g.52049  ORF Transcript_17867/g.52049 Transcript_17867/m.52049 type:complete len:528 (+) Transcript_17867:37-1620(+)
MAVAQFASSRMQGCAREDSRFPFDVALRRVASAARRGHSSTRSLPVSISLGASRRRAQKAEKRLMERPWDDMPLALDQPMRRFACVGRGSCCAALRSLSFAGSSGSSTRHTKRSVSRTTSSESRADGSLSIFSNAEPLLARRCACVLAWSRSGLPAALAALMSLVSISENCRMRMRRDCAASMDAASSPSSSPASTSSSASGSPRPVDAPPAAIATASRLPRSGASSSPSMSQMHSQAPRITWEAVAHSVFCRASSAASFSCARASTHLRSARPASPPVAPTAALSSSRVALTYRWSARPAAGAIVSRSNFATRDTRPGKTASLARKLVQSGRTLKKVQSTVARAVISGPADAGAASSSTCDCVRSRTPSTAREYSWAAASSASCTSGSTSGVDTKADTSTRSVSVRLPRACSARACERTRGSRRASSFARAAASLAVDSRSKFMSLILSACAFSAASQAAASCTSRAPSRVMVCPSTSTSTTCACLPMPKVSRSSLRRAECVKGTASHGISANELLNHSRAACALT